MLKVFLILQDEPFYIPKMVKYLLNTQGKEFSIVGYTIMNPHRKNKRMVDWVKERTKLYNFQELSFVGFAFLVAKLLSKFGITSSYSSKKLLVGQKISEIESDDINSTQYINRLKELDLDIIISISCPQIFQGELLSVPKVGCFNAHGTLLPRHRGVFGSWWTLFLDDEFAGSTIHTMELKLDAGVILWQKEFEVQKSDSQYSIAYKTKRDMAFGLVEVLQKQYNNEKLEISPKYHSSYHRAPSRTLGREFHKKGKRVIVLRDLKKMLSQSF